MLLRRLAVVLSKASLCCVPAVLRMAAPFQIANAVVGFVAVPVMHKRVVVRIWNERFGNKAMDDLSACGYVVAAQVALVVAVCVLAYSYVPLALPHLSHVANFIIRMAGNPFPFLFHDVLSQGAASGVIWKTSGRLLGTE